MALYWSDNAARRAELAGEALAIARRLGDEPTLAMALSSAQLATTGPDMAEQGLAWLEELFALIDRTGETVMSLAARSRHVDVLLELDDISAADMAIERSSGSRTRAATRARPPLPRCTGRGAPRSRAAWPMRSACSARSPPRPPA